MTTEQILTILNYYNYRNRNNWKITQYVHLMEVKDEPVSFMSYPQQQFDPERYTLDEFGASAIAEKLTSEIKPNDFTSVINSINNSYEKQLKELSEDYDNKICKLHQDYQEQNAIERRQQEEEHKRIIDDMQAQHDLQINRIKEKLQKELNQLQKQNKELSSKNLELEDLYHQEVSLRVDLEQRLKREKQV